MATNYRPTVEEVAVNIRNRTINQFSAEVGTFDDTTTPKDDAVEKVIDNAENEITSIFGETIPDAPGSDPEMYKKSAENIVALLAAAKIELTYYGKEVARENSPYKYLLAELDRALLWLATALGIPLPGDIDPGSNGEVPSGSHKSIWGNEVPDPYTDMATRPF